MLQSLNLDAAKSALKPRDRSDEPAADPAFSGMLALLAGTLQHAPLPTLTPAAKPTSGSSEVRSETADRKQTLLAERSRSGVQDARQAPQPSRTKGPGSEDSSSAGATRKVETSRAKDTEAAPAKADQTRKSERTPSAETQKAQADSTAQDATSQDCAKTDRGQGAPQTDSVNSARAPLTASGADPLESSRLVHEIDAPSELPAETAEVSSTQAEPAMQGKTVPLKMETVQGMETIQAATQIATAEPASSMAVTSGSKPEVDAKNLVVRAGADVATVSSGPTVTALTGMEGVSAQAQTQATIANPDISSGAPGISSKAPSGTDGIGGRHTAPVTADPMTAPLQPAKAQVPTAAAASPSTPRSVSAFSQVEGTIRWMVRNQEKSAELQLHPDKLGRVNISLRVEGQEVHARVWASEASTVPILQEHRATLEQSLREQGLNLGSFDLQSGNRGEDAQRQNQGSSIASASSSVTRRESLDSLQDVPTLADQLIGNTHQIEVFA